MSYYNLYYQNQNHDISLRYKYCINTPRYYYITIVLVLYSINSIVLYYVQVL